MVGHLLHLPFRAKYLWLGVGENGTISFLAKSDALPQDRISQIDLILTSPSPAQRLQLLP